MKAPFNYSCCSLHPLKLLEMWLGRVFLARAAVPTAEGISPAGNGNNQNCHFKNNSQFIPFSVQLKWELN